MEELKVHQLIIGSMDNVCYIVEDEETKECILIDPGWDVDKVETFLKENSLRCRYVINTHGHYDHCQKNKEMKDAMDVKIISHELEADETGADIRVGDGDSIDFNTHRVEFIHTPGHSPGSMLVKIGNNLFTGDTLFIGNIGRTDLPGSNPEKMLRSLEKIKKMDDDLIVWPGHDYESVKSRTLGEEKKKNNFLI